MAENPSAQWSLPVSVQELWPPDKLQTSPRRRHDSASFRRTALSECVLCRLRRHQVSTYKEAAEKVLPAAHLRVHCCCSSSLELCGGSSHSFGFVFKEKNRGE